MRRILIARARRKHTQRRGAGAAHLDFDELEIASPAPDDQLLALNEALDRFAAVEPQQAELVKLRYFVGLKIEEAAEVLGISEATAKRWWAYGPGFSMKSSQNPQVSLESREFESRVLQISRWDGHRIKHLRLWSKSRGFDSVNPLQGAARLNRCHFIRRVKTCRQNRRNTSTDRARVFYLSPSPLVPLPTRSERGEGRM
jgi:hypothetical protein